MEKVKRILIRLAFIGVVGTLVGVLLCLLEAFGRVRFRYFERFPFWREKIIVVSNHPTTKEVCLIPLMFFPWWFRKFLKPHPIPISTPDRRNFPYFELLKEYFVFIYRGIESTYKRGKALIQLKQLLNEGANIILFIEGTRTGKATEKIYSQQGKALGVPQSRVGYLVKETGAAVTPLWVETSWGFPPNSKIPFFFHVVVDLLSLLITVNKIKSGWPLEFDREGKSEEEIDKEVVEAMLKLADEK